MPATWPTPRVWVAGERVGASKMNEISAGLGVLYPYTTAGDLARRSAAGNYLEREPDSTYKFPVGYVFISVVSTNPATLLGYGTWVAFGAGRVLVGIDAGQTEFDTVEEAGGAKTHTLITSEMPAHTHVQDSHNHTQNAHAHTIGIDIVPNAGGNVGDRGYTGTSSTSSVAATNQAATATNQNSGGGGAHNNLQPYIVVYMWKRTA